MFRICLAVAIVALLASVAADAKQFYDVCDQVKLLGYPCEKHSVQTEDGFLLGAIRMPPKRTPSAGIVILQHGLLDSAVTWVANARPQQNLACQLHDAGYDAWLGNSRGNHYSMRNVNFPNGPDGAANANEYWESIDMDQMAEYDIPAMIGYVLLRGAPHHRTIAAYVGHSQGTWQAFAAFSSWHKGMAAAVDLFVALAPVTSVKHTTSGLVRLLADLDVGTILELFGDKEFLANDWLVRKLGALCPYILGWVGIIITAFSVIIINDVYDS